MKSRILTLLLLSFLVVLVANVGCVFDVHTEIEWDDSGVKIVTWGIDKDLYEEMGDPFSEEWQKGMRDRGAEVRTWSDEQKEWAEVTKTFDSLEELTSLSDEGQVFEDIDEIQVSYENDKRSLVISVASPDLDPDDPDAPEITYIYTMVLPTKPISHNADTYDGDRTLTWNIADEDRELRVEWVKPAHTLTISSTDGGSVLIPGEGTFTYEAGTQVNLAASPDSDDYRFINWTGDVGTIGNARNPVTTIIMDGNYSITANFAVRRCFVATAAYGTPMAEEAEILRTFRDGYLLTNPLGHAFVDFYYRVSPPIAEFITEHPNLKLVVRVVLVPAVGVSTVVVNTSPAQKAAIAGMLVLASVIVAVWATRRPTRGTEHT